MSHTSIRVGPDSQLSEAQHKELKDIFDRFDDDGDGYISKEEFEKAIKDVKFKNVTADDIMRVTDIDRNSRVSFQEFVDAALYTTNERGESTKDFNILIRLVAIAYVKKNDKETISYLKNYRCCPPPIFMLLFTLAQVGVYIYYSQEPCGPSLGRECPLSFSTEIAFRPGCRDQVWRFLTYMFVHADAQHIAFNVILQLIVGVPLEMVHGPWRTCLVYILGGLAGSMASSVVDPNINLVGASAGVYALVGAHVADVFLNWAEMPFRWLRAGVLIVLFVVDLSLSINNRYNGSGENVSYSGHLAGFVTGCTLGTMVLKNLQHHKYEKIMGYVGLGIYICGVIFAIFFNIFYDYAVAPCP